MATTSVKPLKAEPGKNIADVTFSVRRFVSRLRTGFLNNRDFWLIIGLSLFVFLGVRAYSLRTVDHPAPISFDANWNRSIIVQGYSTDGSRDVEHNVAFSPLYPLVCRFFIALGMGVDEAMFAVSTLSSILGFYLIYAFIRRHYPTHVARSAMALLALNPFALFFYNGYSEGLFLLLIALFFYFLEVRPVNWAAALTVGLASAVRPYGCLLVLIFAFELLRRQYQAGGVRTFTVHLQELLLLAPLCFTGLIAQTLYLGYTFQEPLAFSHSHAAWGFTPGQNIRWEKLVTFSNVLDSIQEFNLRPSPTFAAGLILFLATPVVTAFAWRKLKPSLVAFTLLMFAFFQFTGHYGAYHMVSVGRHMMVVFPVALMAAISLQGEQVGRFATVLVNRDGMTEQDSISWRFFCSIPLYGVVLVSIYFYAMFVYRYFHHIFIS